jgi:hypothetical protein
MYFLVKKTYFLGVNIYTCLLKSFKADDMLFNMCVEAANIFQIKKN